MTTAATRETFQFPSKQEIWEFLAKNPNTCSYEADGLNEKVAELFAKSTKNFINLQMTALKKIPELNAGKLTGRAEMEMCAKYMTALFKCAKERITSSL